MLLCCLFGTSSRNLNPFNQPDVRTLHNLSSINIYYDILNYTFIVRILTVLNRDRKDGESRVLSNRIENITKTDLYNPRKAKTCIYEDKKLKNYLYELSFVLIYRILPARLRSPPSGYSKSTRLGLNLES